MLHPSLMPSRVRRKEATRGIKSSRDYFNACRSAWGGKMEDHIFWHNSPRERGRTSQLWAQKAAEDTPISVNPGGSHGEGGEEGEEGKIIIQAKYCSMGAG